MGAGSHRCGFHAFRMVLRSTNLIEPEELQEPKRNPGTLGTPEP
jgi:hypothetical protein